MDLLGYDAYKTTEPRNFDEEKEEAREYLGELYDEIDALHELSCPIPQETLDELDRMNRLLGY